MTDDAWMPKTKDDWSGMFADGIALARSREEEERAKNPPPEKDKPDDGDKSPPKTIAERLLGGFSAG